MTNKLFQVLASKYGRCTVRDMRKLRCICNQRYGVVTASVHRSIDAI